VLAFEVETPREQIAREDIALDVGLLGEPVERS
jgi:hypothetical protein